MWKTILGTLESKAFVVALLTTVAGWTAAKGFNIPVETVVMLMSPIMVAIGAAGWGEAKAMREGMTQLAMHKMSLEAANTNRALMASDAPKNAQAGFARIHVMIIIAVLGAGVGTVSIATQSGCGTVKPIVTDVIDCAKAEAATVSNGYSIIQVVNTVLGVFAGKPLPGCEGAANVIECDIEKLGVTFGEDIVACVIDSMPTPGTGSGSAADTLLAQTKADALGKLTHGKKIVHNYKKGGI